MHRRRDSADFFAVRLLKFSGKNVFVTLADERSVVRRSRCRDPARFHPRHRDDREASRLPACANSRVRFQKINK